MVYVVCLQCTQYTFLHEVSSTAPFYVWSGTVSLQLLNDRQKELENHRVALATTKSQYEQAKDGLQRAKETEVSAVIHDYAMKFSDVFILSTEWNICHFSSV